MKKKKRGIRIIAVILIVLLLLAGGTIWYACTPYNYEPTRIKIPAGATKTDVENIFKKSLGDSYGTCVALIWQAVGGTPEKSHGSYIVNHGERAFRTAYDIAKGRQTPVRFTFNNSRYLSEVAAKAAVALEMDSVAFLNAVDSVLAARGYTQEQYPAGIMPDTYEFYWTSSPETVATRLVEYRDKFWTEERLKKAEALNLKPIEVHTLASIIEEETNRMDERGAIARLYLNRLDAGMRLQADPTVKYALGNHALRRVSWDLSKYENEYNTYRIQGLPPGPIRVAEGRSIDQVLNAPKHNYLFMCAKPDFSGYHNFSEGYAEHRVQAQAYHEALNKAGIYK